MTKINPQNSVQQPQQKDDPYRKVAKLYEKQFLREMVKAMRGSVQRSDLVETSLGQKIYEENLDNEYVEKWGDSGGIGLADMIYEQLMERYGNKKVPSLPRDQFIPLENKNIEDLRLDPKSGQLQIQIKSKETGAQLKAPSGIEIISSAEPLTGFTRLKVQYENGQEADWLFQGKTNVTEGQKVKKGHLLGQLDSGQSQISITVRES